MARSKSSHRPSVYPSTHGKTRLLGCATRIVSKRSWPHFFSSDEHREAYAVSLVHVCALPPSDTACPFGNCRMNTAPVTDALRRQIGVTKPQTRTPVLSPKQCYPKRVRTWQPNPSERTRHMIGLASAPMLRAPSTDTSHIDVAEFWKVSCLTACDLMDRTLSV